MRFQEVDPISPVRIGRLHATRSTRAWINATISPAEKIAAPVSTSTDRASHCSSSSSDITLRIVGSSERRNVLKGAPFQTFKYARQRPSLRRRGRRVATTSALAAAAIGQVEYFSLQALTWRQASLTYQAISSSAYCNHPAQLRRPTADSGDNAAKQHSQTETGQAPSVPRCHPQGNRKEVDVANASKSRRILVVGRDSRKVIHMRTPWTMNTGESLFFFGLVLFLAGAGTYASVL
jgi:hypothetical protein